MKITQETLITNKEVREENINRVEVLEQVKQLLLLPNTEYATAKQVAEFFEVNIEAVNSLTYDNRQELESDGLQTFKKIEIIEKLNVPKEQVTNTMGKSIIILNDGSMLTLPNRGLRLFPRRAILRVAMLLRDSKIAQEIRTQLLNIEEKVSNEVKVMDIEEEQRLQLAIFQATNDNDRLLAIANLDAFRKRYIQQLEITKKALAKDKLQFKTPRKLVNNLVNRYTTIRYDNNYQGWFELNRELLLKEEKGINIGSRRTRARKRGEKATFSSVIREEEFPLVISTITAMCENAGIDVSDILKEAEELV